MKCFRRRWPRLVVWAEFADAGKIRILRHKESETVVLTVNYNVVRSGGDVSADVPVEPGDTVQVP